MASNGPRQPEEDPVGSRTPDEPPASRTTDDLLRRLEERLGRASDAAERLIAEATAEARARIPPAGWQRPGADGRASPDLELIVQLLESMRELIPSELQRRLTEALRELLLAVRALIDWYLERLERDRVAPAKVEDIPIA